MSDNSETLCIHGHSMLAAKRVTNQDGAFNFIILELPEEVLVIK